MLNLTQIRIHIRTHSDSDQELKGAETESELVRKTGSESGKKSFGSQTLHLKVLSDSTDCGSKVVSFDPTCKTA